MVFDLSGLGVSMFKRNRGSLMGYWPPIVPFQQKIRYCMIPLIIGSLFLSFVLDLIHISISYEVAPNEE